MTTASELGISDQPFVGRERERQAFNSLANLQGATGLSLCILRGLGGIGKSTLASKLADDFTAGPDTSSIKASCVALPGADLASLMRLVGRASASPAGDELIDTAGRMDRLGSQIRTGPAPPDLDEAQLAAWSSAREASLEFLHFFTAAALESAVLGQPTSTASSAVIAGFRAAIAAATPTRAALGTIADGLRRSGHLSEGLGLLADDPEEAVLDAWASFFAAEGRHGSLCIVLDKAENLTPVLFRLTDILAGAAARAEVHVVLVLSGRLTAIPAPDGSALSCSDFIRTTVARGLDLDLPPLRPSDIEQLFAITHERMHPASEKNRPPEWLTQRIHAVTEGLPLWVALMIESICSAGPRIWENEARAESVLPLASQLPLEELMASIFQGIELGGGSSAFPLLISLAIAPETVNPSDAVRAAGATISDLSELSNRYSFMSGTRLHDSAKSLLREYLLRGAGAGDIIKPIAATLLAGLEKPGHSPLEGHGLWTSYICDSAELTFWVDREAGAWQTLEYLCQGLPGWAPWLGPLPLAVGRFLETLPMHSDVRVASRAIGRVAYPAVLGHVLTLDLDVDTASNARKYALSAAGASGFVGAVGRYLETALRILINNPERVAPETIACIEAEHLWWLTCSGFQDEAIALAGQLRGRVTTSPRSAPVRERFAQSIEALIATQLRWCASDPAEITGALSSIVSLMRILIEVHAPTAPGAMQRAISVLGPIGELEECAESLVDHRDLLLESSEYAADVGDLLVALGRFRDAGTLLRRTVVGAPGWIRGREVLCRASLADADDASVLDTAAEVIAQHGDVNGFPSDGLSAYGRKVFVKVCGWGAIAAFFSRDESKAAEMMKYVNARGYVHVMGSILTGRHDEARLLLQALVDQASAADFAAELAVLEAARGNHETSTRLLDEWRQASAPAFYRALDFRLLQFASSEGWINLDELGVGGDATS
jgi:hypothetical protein